MFNIVWHDYLDVPMYRNGVPQGNPRPETIDADAFEVVVPTAESSYGTYINFTKEGRLVAALFTLPLAVMPVADIQE